MSFQLDIKNHRNVAYRQNTLYNSTLPHCNRTIPVTDGNRISHKMVLNIAEYFSSSYPVEVNWHGLGRCRASSSRQRRLRGHVAQCVFDRGWTKYCQQWRRRRRVIHNDNPCVNCVKKDYMYAKELWDLIRFESSLPILCHLQVAVQFKTFSQRASKVFIYNAVFHIPWPMLQWRPNLWASNTQTGAFCWQCVGTDTETVEYELDKQATVRQLTVYNIWRQINDLLWRFN